MPSISMFLGIVIYMYFRDDKNHKIPHIHAEYQGYEASYSIMDGEPLAGKLPQKQQRLVQAWIELHQEELLADWNLAAKGEMPYKIDPLR